MSWMKEKQAAQRQAARPPEPKLPVRVPLDTPEGADPQYGVWLQAAKMDWDRLKTIGDHAERNRQKPALLAKYRETLAHYMANGYRHDNQILAMCIIWAADCGDWQRLFDYTDYAVRIGQRTMLLKRSLWAFAADAVYQSEDPCSEQWIEPLIERISGPEPRWPLKNRPQEAKIFRRAGKDAEARGETEQAVAYLQTAYNLDGPNVGVKTRLERLKARLKTDSSSQAPDGGAAQAEQPGDPTAVDGPA